MKIRVAWLFPIALFWLTLVPSAEARDPAIFTWNGGGGDWAAGSKWTPYAPPEYDSPQGLDSGVIPGGNPSIITDRGINTLTLNNGAALSITNGLVNGVISSGSLRFNTCDTCPKEVTVTNNGTIEINNSASGQTSGMTTWDNTVTLTGTGTVVLGGHPQNYLDNSGWGGTYVNDTGHTIRGGGTITAGITNHNQIIADSGLLDVHGAITNGSGNLSVTGSDSVLQLRGLVQGGWIYPNDGTVLLYPAALANLNVGPGKMVNDPSSGVSYFKGTVSLQAGAEVTLQEGSWLFFDNAPDATPPTLTNNGIIRLNGGGAQFKGRPEYPTTVTLTGSGRIVMGGDFNNLVSASSQGAAHTIEGGGSVNGIVNNGKVIANNGTLKLANFSGPGTVTVADNATLDIGDAVSLISLSLPQQANLFSNSGSLNLTGNFSFAMTDVAKMTWLGGATLEMKGQGPWQYLEVGGKDLGAVGAGFNNNFVLNILGLSGAGTRVCLVDAIDNGHRSPGVPECLYVKSNLYVRTGTTLNLNGLKLYAYWYDTWGAHLRQVKAGDGSLFGGGQIIDVGPGRTAPAVNSLLLQ